MSRTPGPVTLLLAAALAALPFTVRGAEPAPEAAPVRLDLEAEWRAQHRELLLQLKCRRWFAKAAPHARHPAGLILGSDRDPADIVLRRTEALLAYTRGLPGAPDLSGATAKLAGLRARGEGMPPGDATGRLALYLDACRLRRAVALRSPLLTFDRVLFLRRARARYDHMCDQFYGFNAVPGGALLVLENAFGEAPRLRDVLALSTVESGRLRGQRLAGGGFLSTAPSATRRPAAARAPCPAASGHSPRPSSPTSGWATTA